MTNLLKALDEIVQTQVIHGFILVIRVHLHDGIILPTASGANFMGIEVCEAVFSANRASNGVMCLIHIINYPISENIDCSFLFERKHK